ncbi:MAG: hypothetical protein KF861_00195 [Planctomycetaceae bacterium]|nr:hypothetical protein [Planctomycetaceae bacterium]
MSQGKRTWLPAWIKGKPTRRQLVLAAAVCGLLAIIVVWFRAGPGATPPVYEVFVQTNTPGEDRDETAREIQHYLSKDFPPDEYEYVGIVAQQLPTPHSPSTTTYVLFKRK